MDGLVALVTGAGAGIGRMAAASLAEAGAGIAVTDRDGAAANRVAKELGRNAAAFVIDVADEAAIVAGTRAVLERFGRIDVLVNNAGIARRQSTVEMSRETWDQVMAVNLTGLFLMTREAVKPMLAQRSGSIVNIASIMGHVGGGLYPNPAYHASKGAVVNLTRAWACEFGPCNVRCNAIAPTFVNTDLARPMLSDPTMRAKLESLHPLGRLAEVDDLAGAILYLASPASAMVTGHSLAVDGGWLSR
ncbi:MAG: glucose 1-dehydrogenase [Alphaproteobacteria bacterium]|nr:glucose 1-dehydrogenase [Alphaproteobacteria bacterium]